MLSLKNALRTAAAIAALIVPTFASAEKLKVVTTFTVLADMAANVAGDAAFVHDTFMHVDVGTSRADFPGGSSSELFDSLQAILALPDRTRLFIGHDYPPVGERQEPAWEATAADHRANNPHVGGGASREAFMKIRDERDATLGMPARILYALQFNLRGGRLPDAESDGNSYFKIPANRF